MNTAVKKLNEKSPYSTPNLERALTVIEILMINPDGLTLAQLQEISGFPKTSLFRITQTLLEKGFMVKRDQPAILSLSSKFLHVGLSTLSESSIVEKSLPLMRQLRDELKETILLGSIVGQEGVLLEQVLGTHPFTFMLQIGKKFELNTSAPGKAIIAFLPQEDRVELIANMKFKKYNNRTIINKKDYLEELQTVRRKGYAIDYAEELEGVHCVGAPIFNQYGQAISAIWTTAPSSRLLKKDFESYGAKIKKTALDISSQFGYAPSSK